MNEENSKFVSDEFEVESMDPYTKYLLVQSNNCTPLSLLYGDARNGNVFVGSLKDAISLLNSLDNKNDYRIVSEKEYSRICQACIQTRIDREKKIIEQAEEITLNNIEYNDFLLIDIFSGLTTRIITFPKYLEWIMRDDFKALEDKLKK